MKPEQQRIAIAESVGWKCWHLPGTRDFVMFDPTFHKCGEWIEGKPSPDAKLATIYQPPNYPADLNEMREAIKTLTKDHRNRYLNILCELTRDDEMDDVDADFAWCDATAAQRAESFLKAIGRWVEP